MYLVLRSASKTLFLRRPFGVLGGVLLTNLVSQAARSQKQSNPDYVCRIMLRFARRLGSYADETPVKVGRDLCVVNYSELHFCDLCGCDVGPDSRTLDWN